MSRAATMSEVESVLEKQLFANLRILGFHEYMHSLQKKERSADVDLKEGIFVTANQEALFVILRYLLNLLPGVSPPGPYTRGSYHEQLLGLLGLL